MKDLHKTVHFALQDEYPSCRSLKIAPLDEEELKKKTKFF